MRETKNFSRDYMIKQVMEADGNKDGKISWEEFKVMIDN